MSDVISVSRHRRSARLTIAAALALWILPSAAVKAGTANEKPLKLFRLASRCALRLVVKGRALDGGVLTGWRQRRRPGRRTAPGAALIDPRNRVCLLILATAYHVLAGAESFTVWAPYETGQIATSTPDTESFVDRSCEIVFLRVASTPG